MQEKGSRRRRRRTRSREKMHDGFGDGLNMVGDMGILVRGRDGGTNVGDDSVEQDGNGGGRSLPLPAVDDRS